MLRSCSVFFLIAGLQVVISQSPPADEEDDGGPKGPYVANDPRQGPFFEPYQEMIPRHCWGPPANVNPYECCPMPKVFTDEEMATCGIEKPNLDKPPPSPEKFANCSHGKCLLKGRDLLTDAEEIHYDKTRKFLEDWGKANPDFEDAIKIAIGKCVVEGGPDVRHGKCVIDKIFFCMASTILWNCKLRQDLEQCTVLQEHMIECRPYYLKPKSQE